MPETEIPETASSWRSRLYARLRGQAAPLLISEERITPAGSLWAGMRLWTAAFREAGLRPGDRVVLALPPSPGFLCALLAGLWEGLTLAPLNPAGEVENTLEALDATASIGTHDVTWRADACGLPVPTGMPLRPAELPRTPEARLLLATSGTGAAPHWIALSDANILAVLNSHGPHLNLMGARLLSALPWHHVFGLVIDLLPGLLAGAEIIRESGGGRDPAQMIALMHTHQITHLNAVPLMIERLLQAPGGELLVTHLKGGVIGGAPVNASLAEALSRTKLRTGYGQTEASPGIALGAPGRWKAGYLGQPVGCTVRIEADHHLHFSGPNACLGTWQPVGMQYPGMQYLAPDRWVDTGDLIRAEGQNLFFIGRAGDGFKLSNGRFVQAALWESHLKAQISPLREAVLHSPDGKGLELLVTCVPGSSGLPLPLARELLAGLGSRLDRVRELPWERWVRTPKGNIDRSATITASDDHTITASDDQMCAVSSKLGSE